MDSDEYAFFVMQHEGQYCAIYYAPVETRPLMQGWGLLELNIEEAMQVWDELSPHSCYVVDEPNEGYE